MTTALIYDPIFLEHITPRNHPDQPQRLEAAMQILEMLNWLHRDGLIQLAPRAATEDELATVHDREYIQEVKEAVRKVLLPDELVVVTVGRVGGETKEIS